LTVCATLGELSEDNQQSWFRKNEHGTSSDPTANCVLQVLLNKDDNKLWDEMDQATFEAIGAMAGEGQSVEWWHQPQPKDGQDLPPGVWKDQLPGQDTIRMPGIVHEASVIPSGKGNECPVDDNYKVKGVSNVVSCHIQIVIPTLDLIFIYSMSPVLHYSPPLAHGAYNNHSAYVLSKYLPCRNPTMTMCGFAQDLAIKLTPKKCH